MTDIRKKIHSLLSNLITAPESHLPDLLKSGLTHDCQWDIAHPVNELIGANAIQSEFIMPLRKSLSHVHRRDDIFIGGPNRRESGGYWVASVAHYVGNFTDSLFGVKPSNRLAFLRTGEFYRIEGDRMAEGKIIIDLLDLMRQAGNSPLPQMLGTEMLFPSPATHDGVMPNDRNIGEKSLDIVESMINDLHEYDPENFTSKNQTGAEGYWHEDMLWYGPAGIGSNYRWEGFEKDHRRSFLTAFPDRKGGNHFCRIGNGNFAAFSGWPSMTMTHQGDYLGVPATGKSLSLRVMDFYRCAEGKIMENWVLLDYLDLFNQIGIDLIQLARGSS